MALSMESQATSEVWLWSNCPGSGCLFAGVCECKGAQLLGCSIVEVKLWQGTPLQAAQQHGLWLLEVAPRCMYELGEVQWLLYLCSQQSASRSLCPAQACDCQDDWLLRGDVHCIPPQGEVDVSWMQGADCTEFKHCPETLEDCCGSQLNRASLSLCRQQL